MSNFLKIAMFLCSIAFVLSCKTNKANSKAEKARTKCLTEGIIRDMRGLDGCTFLFVLNDGTKILPIEMPDNIQTLKDGSKIFFDYEKVDDAMSICMAETFMANITCLEFEFSNACIEIKHLNERNWAKDLLPKLRPAQILKYPIEESWQYVFYGQSGNYLYNCDGNLICKTRQFKESDCFTHLHGQKGELIWRSEENNH